MSKEHKLTAEEWTELYEALQILKAACDACGIETQCLEVQSVYAPNLPYTATRTHGGVT